MNKGDKKSRESMRVSAKKGVGFVSGQGERGGGVYDPALGDLDGPKGTEYQGKIESYLSAADAHRKKGNLLDSYRDLRDATRDLYKPNWREDFTEAQRVKYLGAISKRAARLVGVAQRRNDAEILEEASNLQRMVDGEVRHRNRAKQSVVVSTIIGVLGGVFFLSTNITGNVIGSLNQTSSNWIGGILFLIGLVGAFAYFKRR